MERMAAVYGVRGGAEQEDIGQDYMAGAEVMNLFARALTRPHRYFHLCVLDLAYGGPPSFPPLLQAAEPHVEPSATLGWDAMG